MSVKWMMSFKWVIRWKCKTCDHWLTRTHTQLVDDIMLDTEKIGAELICVACGQKGFGSWDVQSHKRKWLYYGGEG